MAFIEIKGTLAKLLATENLHVQHDCTVHTASFNTATRVLTLPVLQTESQYVYDMFIGHEVGHALYTPTDWRDNVPENVPFDFVNVVEDVRIERMIQDKFPGLRKDFSHGYTELNNKDFFEIADKDISKLSFVDRINLHFKLGDRAVIPFSNDEMTYVRAVEDADTFEKVCLVSKMLAEYVNAKRQEEQPQMTEVLSDGDGGEDEGDSDKTTPSPEDTEDEETPADEGESTDAGVDENKSTTQESMDKNLEKLSESDDTRNRVTYLRAPEMIDIASVITPVEFLREDYNSQLDVIQSYRRDAMIERFNDFMSSIKRDVNFMVQQFEMRKSADAYARQQVNKTGVLDTEKLHQYKLTDDIFLRQTVTPDGKSHGMVMLIDWSGSMQDKVLQTTKQLLVLAQFCRKVNISFDVYTFTCSGYGVPDIDGVESSDVFHMMVSYTGPKLVHVLSSSSKRRELDNDMRNLFANALAITNCFSALPTSSYLHMGGTPLNNTLFLYPELVKRLKERTGAQKVSTVTITDGESTPLYYYSVTQGRRYIHNNMISPYETVLLRDGTHVYQLDSSTGSIVKYLQKKMPDVTFTHIFLGGAKTSEKYIGWMSGYTAEVDANAFRKQGSYVLTNVNGWPVVALVNPNTFGETSDEIKVDQGATKSQVRAALKKMLKSKSSSKVLLTQLVQQFA